MQSRLRGTEGLYDPANEHDACGVGFVVNLRGEKSHQIVRSGLEILVNLAHRGACGCDPLTGDGAGILTQIPHELMTAKCRESGFELPAPGSYGMGMIFLPNDARECTWCVERLEQIIAEEGQRLLGWRDVPVDNEHIGPKAREVEPALRQVFIAAGPGTPADMLDWKLYVIRKRLEKDLGESQLVQKEYCYVPSLSTRVMIYKGLMLPDQVERFYLDLADPRFTSALALVHQRYSTNTFPTWDLAHPFHFLAHNGEINTVRGNSNWMHARQSMLASEKYGPDLKKLGQICTPGASDSATFDNVLELLVLTGRTLPQAVSMLIPEPWSGHESMPDEKRAYYEYQACLMEPWDGPASIAFTDGTSIGAVLDRNGLRPSRYWVTKDGLVIMASEAGVLDIPAGQVASKGRLRPGRMFLVDTSQGRIITDEEIKHQLASRHPYRQWLKTHQLTLADLPEAGSTNGHAEEPLVRLQRAFGYTLEDLRVLMAPMATDAQEPIGSMGNDTPLAVLSDRPQLLYNYFKQLFAQVTNPPLDAIREEIVTSLVTTIGSEGNLLEETPEQCRLLRLDQPILSN
ncbi:MAG TPA: glutamate synthase central domain-containing protein, partial [Pirellulales bacterium]|nr:glutamate synthase central domain-containing protein [Pirellulales bacterium]